MKRDTTLQRKRGWGDGVPLDYLEARTQFEIAAARGNLDAMYMLGCLYRDGRGVEKNRVTAHMWFNIAASHESYPARRGKAVEARVELEADMASEETRRSPTSRSRMGRSAPARLIERHTENR